MDIDLFIDEQFNTAANSIGTWRIWGHSSLHARDVLVDRFLQKSKEFSDDHLLLNPIILLSAIGIECFLKGICIQMSGNAFSDKKFKYKTHDLYQLAQNTQIQFNDNELRVLKLLSQYLEWQGRYPVSLTQQKWLLKPSDQSVEIQSYSFETDESILQEIRRKLFEKICFLESTKN